MTFEIEFVSNSNDDVGTLANLPLLSTARVFNSTSGILAHTTSSSGRTFNCEFNFQVL